MSDEITGLFDQAINAHRRNIAKAEIRKADLGLAAPAALDESVASSEREISRLSKMRDSAKNNGRTTNGDRLDRLSAQISGIQGEVLVLRRDTSSCVNEIADVKSVVMELRGGCPLFNPDTPDGPLEFVRKE